ncbi:predicted protein [Postia placenta Mad-698-R]|nr:predicted protein [Postia placenta Mad-698-R]
MILITLFISYLVFTTNIFIAYDHAARTFGYPSLGGPLKYLQLSGITIRQPRWLPVVCVDTKTPSAAQWEVYEEFTLDWKVPGAPTQFSNFSISYVLPSLVGLDELTCPVAEDEEPFAQEADGRDDYHGGDEWCYALPESSFLDHLIWYHTQSAQSMCALTEAPEEESVTTPSIDVINIVDVFDWDMSSSSINGTSPTLLDSPSIDHVDRLAGWSILAMVLLFTVKHSKTATRDTGPTSKCEKKDEPEFVPEAPEAMYVVLGSEMCDAHVFGPTRDVPAPSNVFTGPVSVNGWSRDKKKRKRKGKKNKNSIVFQWQSERRFERATKTSPRLLLFRLDDVKRMWDWIPSRFCLSNRIPSLRATPPDINNRLYVHAQSSKLALPLDYQQNRFCLFHSSDT